MKHDKTQTKRFSIFPLYHENIWKFYKTQVSNAWFVEEVELDQDVKDWTMMDSNLKKLISRVLAIFNFSDIVVCDNVKEIKHLLEPFNMLEAEFFYDAQLFIERIHAEMYSQFLETLIKSLQERNKLLNAVHHFEFAKRKAEVMAKYQGDKSSLNEKLINNACGEQIGFSSLFAVIFWLRKKNLLPGVRLGNSLISQDENLHFSFACELYKTLCKLGHVEKLIEDRVVEIVKDFVSVEITILDDIFSEIPEDELEELTKDNMKKYIKHMADIVLLSLGYSKIYKQDNPFEFMTLINLREQHNFFERKTAEYKLFNVSQTKPEEKNKAYSVEVDF
jgi:ribonucleotide reductase beta subunit family protein with ferritin-like domain